MSENEIPDGDVFADSKTYDIADLIYLMQRLRDPKDGCPWDLEQNFKTIVTSTIEEAYEVADAIEREDYSDLKEELGDYLFQAVFYGQLASEQELFDLESVIDGLVKKLIRRHPHVFPEGSLESRRSDGQQDEESINRRWDELKQLERQAKGLGGVFDDVPKSLPALSFAQKTQKRAARQRFDWQSVEPVYDKIFEEISELKQSVKNQSETEIEEEMGDLLFSCVNLARHLRIDAETALRRATNKFSSRYLRMQIMAKETFPGNSFNELSPEQMDLLWNKSKSIADPAPD